MHVSLPFFLRSLMAFSQFNSVTPWLRQDLVLTSSRRSQHLPLNLMEIPLPKALGIPLDQHAHVTVTRIEGPRHRRDLPDTPSLSPAHGRL